MPLSADEVFVPFRMMKGVSWSDDKALCLGCGVVLPWDKDADHWTNHTVLECLQKIRLAIPAVT